MLMHLLAVALCVLLAHQPAASQSYAEVWMGPSIGNHTATAAGLETVPSFSLQVLMVRDFTPRFSAFAGFVRTSFGCEEGFCTDRELTVTGNHGVLGAEGRLGQAWGRFGILFGSTRVGSDGESDDPGAGFHLGAGYTLGSGRFSFLPGLSYRWMSASTARASEHAVALSAELGARVRLGSGR